MNISHLGQVNINAAGIDIGAEFHYVAVPSGRDPEGQINNTLSKGDLRWWQISLEPPIE